MIMTKGGRKKDNANVSSLPTFSADFSVNLSVGTMHAAVVSFVPDTFTFSSFKCAYSSQQVSELFKCEPFDLYLASDVFL